MSSRKDIRKSLGLSEYPWSSDDDNENQQAEESLNSSVRDNSQDNVYGLNPSQEEPQPSTSSSIHHSRRAEAKKDRETFWSLINNPSVPHVDNMYRIPRKQEVPFPSSLRSVVHVPPVELREETSNHSKNDLRRILVLNKLSTKALSYLRRRPPNPGIHSTVCGETSSQRSTALSQAMSSTHRPNLKFKKLRLTNSNYLSYVRAHDSPPRPSTPGEPVLASPSGYSLNRRSPEPNDVVTRNADVIIADDSVDLEPTDNANLPTTPVRDEVSLEDIIEVDPETDTSAGEQLATSAHDNSEQHQDILNIVDGASPRRGVKRKRDGTEEVDDSEAFKELNRNLLRLLECPVCLEWAEPPIAQCRRGHLVCSCCRARIASCPVCRTSFSSVRNRAMEGVAEMLRYPCRHGCGREVRLRRRAPHEASCPARRYLCPAPACDHRTALLAHNRLLPHFQQEHPAMVLMGPKHLLSVHMNSEQTENWFVSAHQEVFHVRVTVDVRSWGLVVHVSYIGPKCRSQRYIYQVTVIGQHHERQTTYSRATHNHLDCHFLSISKQDCFHLTLDQALNFLRHENRSNDVAQNRHLEFYVEIKKSENEDSLRDDESDS